MCSEILYKLRVDLTENLDIDKYDEVSLWFREEEAARCEAENGVAGGSSNMR